MPVLEAVPLDELVALAGSCRDALPCGDILTFSPKVFLPITRSCRDSCSYCTFVKEPQAGRNVYMTIEEVLDTARLGQMQGCTEALLTLGDKPELKYPQVADELRSLGYGSTIEYVKACAAAILEETTLVPHVNPGIMTEAELLELRTVSASMGLMLESTSRALLDPGMPHHDCPDKDPELRLEVCQRYIPTYDGNPYNFSVHSCAANTWSISWNHSFALRFWSSRVGTKFHSPRVYWLASGTLYAIASMAC